MPAKGVDGAVAAPTRVVSRKRRRRVHAELRAGCYLVDVEAAAPRAQRPAGALAETATGTDSGSASATGAVDRRAAGGAAAEAPAASEATGSASDADDDSDARDDEELELATEQAPGGIAAHRAAFSSVIAKYEALAALQLDADALRQLVTAGSGARGEDAYDSDFIDNDGLDTVSSWRGLRVACRC